MDSISSYAMYGCGWKRIFHHNKVQVNMKKTSQRDSVPLVTVTVKELAQTM